MPSSAKNLVRPDLPTHEHASVVSCQDMRRNISNRRGQESFRRLRVREERLDFAPQHLVTSGGRRHEGGPL